MKTPDHALDSKITIDNKEYFIKDKIIVDRVRYYLLKNMNNNYEILIRKTNDLILLENEIEFDRIYRLFNQRNAF